MAQGQGLLQEGSGSSSAMVKFLAGGNAVRGAVVQAGALRGCGSECAWKGN